jgi:hypothetical protein
MAPHHDRRYDGVFHLVTAAIGAEKFYTLANNTARSETPEQVISSLSPHPVLLLILIIITITPMTDHPLLTIDPPFG